MTFFFLTKPANNKTGQFVNNLNLDKDQIVIIFKNGMTVGNFCCANDTFETVNSDKMKRRESRAEE